MKEIILCDADGVLCNFAETIINECHVEINTDLELDWDIFGHFDRTQIKLMERCCSDPDWWLSLPKLPGSEIFIENLRSQGEVKFVTSPWADMQRGWTCKGWGWARNHWLKNNFDANKDDVIITPSKEFVFGHRLYDDKPKNLSNWSKFWNKIGNSYNVNFCNKPIIVDTKFNQSEKRFPRFSVNQNNWLTPKGD